MGEQARNAAHNVAARTRHLRIKALSGKHLDIWYTFIGLGVGNARLMKRHPNRVNSARDENILKLLNDIRDKLLMPGSRSGIVSL
jgi:hypothetical protein